MGGRAGARKQLKARCRERGGGEARGNEGQGVRGGKARRLATLWGWMAGWKAGAEVDG